MAPENPGKPAVTPVERVEPAVERTRSSGCLGYSAPVSDTFPAEAASMVDNLLADSRSAPLVAAYFDAGSTFAGSLFDTMGVNEPFRVTVDDLFATSLLDVRFGPAATRKILGAEADVISDRLKEIDPGVTIWDEDGQLDGPLADLWSLLCGLPDVGPVTATKLLARKRPELAPIVDRVIIRTLRPEPGRTWRTVKTLLLDGERRARLMDLAPDDDVSTLRLFDVLLWMHGSEARTVRQVRTRLGMVVAPRR